MRISFDLDNTLICSDKNLPHEKDILAFLFKLWFPERLRLGTVALIKQLIANNHTIWLYTSSNRSTKYLRFWFNLYGIKLEGIINQEIHQRMIECGMAPKGISKYPPAFGIDLHIDDSEAVKIEGQRHRFHVVLVKPDDKNWTQVVLDKVDNLSSKVATS
ncbi:MAG: hypothetical protein IPK14_26795 [Blastocatellia bacterium]|nr:hypothetical protein [Blastocatellia bacterium]